MTMPAVRAHLRVQGRVQGVFYRASCRTAALELGLTGWVRNRRDGSVETVAEGPRASVEQFVEWCRKGPPAAQVDEVDVAWHDAVASADSFAVRSTA